MEARCHESLRQLYSGGEAKKLEEAALAIYGRTKKKKVDRSQLTSDLKEWGLSDDDIAHELNHLNKGSHDEDDGPFEIFEENEPAFKLFVGMQTQWRFTQATKIVNGTPVFFSMRTGLDYGALSVVAAAHHIALSDQIMTDLLIMEAAILKEFAK